MRLKEIHSIIADIKQKGYEEGITLDDYKKLKHLMNGIDPFLVADNADWYDVYTEINNILKNIYDSGLLKKYSNENCHYIIENSSLLPLVLANNGSKKIKMYSNNNYLFLCQFHKETTPSMGVLDIKNKLACFGCNTQYNIMSYLQNYEHLSYKEVIELLNQIYLYGLPFHNPKLRTLAKKYYDIIIGEKYKELLNQGYQRFQDRQISDFNGICIESYYQKVFQTIERLKKQEVDEDFSYTLAPTKIYLPK